MDTTTISTRIFGEIALWPDWVTLLLMFLLGAFLFQIWKAKQGANASNGTPSKFNWKYFMTDTQNWGDFGGSLVAAYLFIRFMAPKVDNFDTLMILSVGLGTAGQVLVDIVLEFFRGKNPFAKYSSSNQ